jgi:dipeptidyl aminopeptidase/acylaminoacyl peptidase
MWWPRPQVVKYSPDGTQFVVVLKKGDVDSNTNLYTMLLWKVSDLKKGQREPLTVLEMRSATNYGGMNHLEWSNDNETLWFVGENSGEKQQVYRISARSRELQQVTHHPTNVLSYSRDAKDDRIAYFAERPPEDLWNERTRRNGIVVPRDASLTLPELILGRKGAGVLYDRAEAGAVDLFLEQSGEAKLMRLTRSLPPAYIAAIGGDLALSPDGKLIALATDVPVDEIPAAWAQYEGQESIKSIGKGKERSGIGSYQILDTRSGRTKVLLNTPLRPLFTARGAEQPPVWAPDSNSVILSGAFLPLDVADPVERKARQLQPAVVEVDPISGSHRRIGERCLLAMHWSALTGELACIAEPQGSPARFRKTGTEWQEIRAATDEKPIRVYIKEGLNTPPRLYARQPGKKEYLLLDLNPQFKDLRFGKVEEMSWEWEKGRRIQAGLYYPPNHNAARRYPLVIQTHGWSPDRFEIEGFATTGYGAQALAARDIVVLQLNDYVLYNSHAPLEEMNNAMATFRSAIALLEKRGLVDSRKVAVLGFSHTTNWVAWALAHEPSLFAAASISGESTGGYLQFMSRLGADFDLDAMYGGPPFSRHLRRWMELAPSFNLDRVQAPLRLHVLSAPLYLPMEWEWFEGLNLLGKSVEMVMLETATHSLVKPAERIVVSGGTVDWFDYWLNAHEDPDSTKAAQYSRWRELRNQRDANRSAEVLQAGH